MSTPLPDSLVRFGTQLEQAIERKQRARRRIPIRLAVATAAAVAITLGAVSLPGDEATVVPTVPAASAAERAAAVLSPAPGSIVHTVARYRAVGPDGSVSTWREETWRQASRPYARREITTRGDVRVETATVGERPAALYDPSTNTIYTNPPAGGPALGTPMPATDGDPLREQLASLLRSGEARETARSAGVIRFAYDNPPVKWTYAVDAESYRPIRLTAASPDGSRVTTRFETYEALDDEALVDLRAQHRGAAVDRTEAGYAEAQGRLYAR